MYYKDMSIYEYRKYVPTGLDFEYDWSKHTVLNVGWLDDAHSFSGGKLGPEITALLLERCFSPVNVTRGYHQCELCWSEEMIVERNGAKMHLGSAEMWVPSENGIVYAAPNLIYHYVTEHSYLPPSEFIAALVAFTRTKWSE